MTATTFEEWKKTDGASFASGSDDTAALKAAYDYARSHPKAGFGDVENYWLSQISTNATKSSKGGSSLFDQVTHPYNKSIEDNVLPMQAAAKAKTAGATADPSTGSAPAPVTGGTPAPDAASALDAASKSGDPALAAILQQTLGQGVGGTVTLWSGLGVDPDASVYGAVRPTKTSNTMDKTGRLVHGQGDSLGMGSGTIPTTQTADKWLKGLYTMSPQDLADLQHRLYNQGWYKGTNVNTPEQIQYGRPDAATLQAYGSVLAEGARYNAAGQKISINQVIDLGGTVGTADGKGTPFEATNPADLTAALKGEAQQELGRDPSTGDISNYQDEYLGQEDAARRQIIADQGSNTTEGVTGPASPTAGADAYIDQHNLADKVAYGAAVRQQAFFDMLKSPV